MRKRAPLNAIRAFEAAARHTSVAKAADELCATPTAVSHQLRLLEDFLQVELFERRNSRIYPTFRGASECLAHQRGAEPDRRGGADADRPRQPGPPQAGRLGPGLSGLAVAGAPDRPFPRCRARGEPVASDLPQPPRRRGPDQRPEDLPPGRGQRRLPGQTRHRHGPYGMPLGLSIATRRYEDRKAIRIAALARQAFSTRPSARPTVSDALPARQ